MNKKDKWLINTRKKLFDIAMEFKSAAALNGAGLTMREADYFEKKLKDFVNELQ